MTDKKYTYTNGIKFEETCATISQQLLHEHDKLSTIENIRNLIILSGYNRYTVDEYKKDKYLIPVYVYSILIGDKDTIYFVDEHRGTDNDRIWFLGGNLIATDLDGVRGYYYKDSMFQNNFVHQAFRQLTRSGFQIDTQHDMGIPDLFKDFFTIIPCQSQTTKDIFRLNFNYAFYDNMYSRNKGVYVFTPIVIEPNDKGYLVPYTRAQHRVLMTIRDKDQLTKGMFRREIPNAASRDARWDLFDIITSIFNSLS